MKRLVLLMLIAGGSVFAQPNPQRPPPPTSNLPTAIGNGTNYSTMIPLQMGLTALNVENLSQYPNDILMVGVDKLGNRDSRILEFREAGILRVEETDLKDYNQVYLISMQPFHVKSEKPIEVYGMRTRHFTTVTPTRHLDLVLVENALGKQFMVGVTPDGTAHYPIYGTKIGDFDRESRSVVKMNGAIMDALEK